MSNDDETQHLRGFSICDGRSRRRSPAMQIDPTALRSLVERAKELLNERYDALEAQRIKGAKSPHRLVVLIARAERDGRI